MQATLIKLYCPNCVWQRLMPKQVCTHSSINRSRRAERQSKGRAERQSISSIVDLPWQV